MKNDKFFNSPGKSLKTVLNEAGFSKSADYIIKKNEDVMLLINIESTYAVDNLETLLSYDGVDGVFIGPHDLRYSKSVTCFNIT